MAKKRKRPAAKRASSAPSSSTLSLPAIPSFDTPGESVGSSDRAIAALDQPAPAPSADAPSPSPTSAPAAETAISQTPASAEQQAPTRDRSPVAPAPGKSAPKSDKPKPIALEAKDLKGLQLSELRTMLVVERRRNAELTTRLQIESPIAQAALDEDLQNGIGETATLISEAVAFLIDEPEAKLPPKTSERLGRVWAPIAKKYMGPTMQEHFPLYVAITATISAVMDRAVDVKDARRTRQAIEAERSRHSEPSAPAVALSA